MQPRCEHVEQVINGLAAGRQELLLSTVNHGSAMSAAVMIRCQKSYGGEQQMVVDAEDDRVNHVTD